MTSVARAATFLWLSCLLVQRTYVEATETIPEDDSTCATTDVLVAMSELLRTLSAEVRDLRTQVLDSCNAKLEDDDDDTYLEAPAFRPTPDSMTVRPVETNTDGGDDNHETEETPQNPEIDWVNEMSSMFGSLLPFAPKPDGENAEDTTSLDVTEEPTRGEDVQDSHTTTTTSTTTTSTTTELPFTLPPPRTRCPKPFQLLADGCYIIIHDNRDWKSWGDANAVCQGYGGTLAAPWRLPQLQTYLSRRYSDAFWVGAKINSRRGTWKWLSGRPMRQNEWKDGRPKRIGGRKCVILMHWQEYKAVNSYCGEKYPFICEQRIGQ